MIAIRRQPPAHEQALWPDTLPATMVVPAGFTLYPPADLDLTDTTLEVRGTVVMPPAHASEGAAGLVELATLSETVAGVDSDKAVTPAGVASAIAAAGDVDFDEVEFTELGTGTGLGWNVLCTLKKDGVPITASARALIGLAPSYQGGGLEFAFFTGGTTYSVYGYLGARTFKVGGYLSGTGSTDVGFGWGWANRAGGEGNGQAVAKAYGNPNPYGPVSFGLMVIRSDGAEFESGMFTLPQGQ